MIGIVLVMIWCIKVSLTVHSHTIFVSFLGILGVNKSHLGCMMNGDRPGKPIQPSCFTWCQKGGEMDSGCHCLAAEYRILLSTSRFLNHIMERHLMTRTSVITCCRTTMITMISYSHCSRIFFSGDVSSSYSVALFEAFSELIILLAQVEFDGSYALTSVQEES